MFHQNFTSSNLFLLSIDSPCPQILHVLDMASKWDSCYRKDIRRQKCRTNQITKAPVGPIFANGDGTIHFAGFVILGKTKAFLQTTLKQTFVKVCRQIWEMDLLGILSVCDPVCVCECVCVCARACVMSDSVQVWFYGYSAEISFKCHQSVPGIQHATNQYQAYDMPPISTRHMTCHQSVPGIRHATNQYQAYDMPPISTRHTTCHQW